MPGTDHEMIEVRVHGLRTAHEAIVFTPGTPTAPFSIGANGQWGVVGDGVGAIHLFLGFDGQRVLVAGASPALPVQFAGGSVGSSWVAVPVPSEIRFGAGVLVLRRTARSGAPAQPDAAPSTVSDGGALYQAAQRAHSGPVAGSSSPPRAAVKPKDFGATVLMDPRAQATSDAPPPPPPPAAMDKRLQAPTAIASSPPRPPPRAPSPPPPSPDFGGSAPSSPSLDESVLKKNFWQAASPVKKATIVLLPVALVLSFFMLQDDHPPAPTAPPAAGSLAARAPSPPPMTAPPPAQPQTPVPVAPAQPAAVAPALPSVARTAPTAASAPPAALAAAAKPGDPPGKAGQRSAERMALDTVASGAFDDAARQYDALAMAHPDDSTFKQAARVLRLKSGHTH